MEEMSDAPLHLDIDRAREMIGEEAVVREILQMAEASLRRDIPRMRELLRAGNMAAANGILHTIKGMLPVFCADPLLEQVGAGERLARTASLGDFLPTYDAIEKNLARLLREIETHLKNGPAP